MTSALALPTPGAKPVDLLINSRGPSKLTPTKEAKARSTAQDFEAVFLNSMFQNMFTGVSGEGPFGGSGAVGVWRSMLTDEYSRSFAKGGGIGIADQVYRSLMARQEPSRRDLIVQAIAEDRADAHASAAMAKSYACGSAVDVVGKAMQLHGGIGYTWESGIHVYLKRAALNRSLFGSPADHRRELAKRYL